MTTIPDEHDLHAYVDGRLEGEALATVEAWLARNPQRAGEIEAWRRDAQALRATFAGATPPPDAPWLDPARLRRELARRQRRWLGLAASVVVALGLGMFTGWSLHDRAATDALAREPMADAVQAHRMFALHAGLRADIDAAPGASLQSWLATSIDPAIRMPDLSAAGYTPSGGRLLATEQGPAALVVYRNAQGDAISFYVRPVGPSRAPLADGERHDPGLLTHYWSAAGYNHAMVGNLHGDGARIVRDLADRRV
ncbi:MAG TPA: anti-sigma factor [Luteimonas sp.]|nr:anti-sigma factor [Luteimonas sp.]HRO26233.1 anti-sigma factor [Luteimonas sp.]HRP71210.1 anti-sigma factor [Luteimonas sp.]